MNRSVTVTMLLVAAMACDRGLSPTESVDALMEAVTAKDSIEIARLVDLPRVSQSAVDPMIEAATRLSDMDPDGFGQQIGDMGVEMLLQFRPMIAPFIEQLFWQMLLDPESARRGMLGSVLAGREIRIDEMAAAYQGVLSEREEGPDTVVVTVELAPDNAEIQPIAVELRLGRAEGYWVVVAFTDLAQIFAELMEQGR